MGEGQAVGQCTHNGGWVFGVFGIFLENLPPKIFVGAKKSWANFREGLGEFSPFNVFFFFGLGKCHYGSWGCMLL